MASLFVNNMLSGAYRGNPGQMFLDLAGTTGAAAPSTPAPVVTAPSASSPITVGNPLAPTAAYPVSTHFGSYYTPQNNAWTPSPGSVTNVMRQNSYANSSNARIEGLNNLAAKNANLNTNKSDPSFWGNILDGFSNLAKTNPMAFITTPIDIWSAFANYRANKQALNMYQDQLNLQREAYEKNEARNQRRFDMLEQARATSQL